MVNKLGYMRLDMQRLARLVPFWDVEEPERRHLPFAHPPERGDVIVFRAPATPEKDFVKRVVGLPGEKVDVRLGSIYVNGRLQVEPYLAHADLTQNMDCIPKTEHTGCRLQEDQYFVLGDNRGNSNDSRDWGPVTLEDIVGKVWFVYWPFSRLPFFGSFVEDR